MAIVLLPQHLHTIWTLPAGDSDYPLQWQKTKVHFTRTYLAQGGLESVRSESRLIASCIVNEPRAPTGSPVFPPSRWSAGAIHNADINNRRERGIWQLRYWEHACFEGDDLKQHVDYIHWNPVKHGLTRRAKDYPWSTFHRFVKLGEYDIDWGGVNPCPGLDMPEP